MVINSIQADLLKIVNLITKSIRAIAVKQAIYKIIGSFYGLKYTPSCKKFNISLILLLLIFFKKIFLL